ncbi:TPA: HNH endonuclease, partial [Escherichia coli]|nr:HNH endonuclease [Escherichia coli]
MKDFKGGLLTLGFVALRQTSSLLRDLTSQKEPEGKCAVTGCSIQVLLEAAHITPYAGAWHTRAQHGLLLKTDIHTLFDRGLLWIDTELKIRISEHLAGTEYVELDGRYLRLPKDKQNWP